MGRPLNKKYFGNRNIGTGGDTPAVGGNYGGDDGIGGEGLAAYTLGNLGSLLINSSFPQPSLTIPNPTLPGGVASTAQVVWEVDSVVVTSTGTSYSDSLPTSVTFTGLSGVVATLVTAPLTGLGTINFSSTTSDRGSFTTVPTAAATYEACTASNPTGGGNNGQVNILYRVKTITTVEKGSGYTTAPTLTWTATTSSGTMPAAPTVALTADSGGFLGSGNNVGGNVNAATQQDNAIVIYANTTNAGTKIGDIRKQKGSRRYQVRTADGIATCKLVADDTPAVGEAYITATDQGGATYWVTKLTTHRATIVPKGVGSPQFPLVNGEPQHVGWTFGTAIAPATNVLGKVKIQNA